VLVQIGREALYAQYESRQQNDMAALRRDEAMILANRLDYLGMAGLSRELADKLHRLRPETLAHASRIEGMTPAALLLILAHARKARPLSANASAG
jgi:tRNA uridine 5-carboxymethylaminomethyl modification enzyme